MHSINVCPWQWEGPGVSRIIVCCHGRLLLEFRIWRLLTIYMKGEGRGFHYSSKWKWWYSLFDIKFNIPNFRRTAKPVFIKNKSCIGDLWPSPAMCFALLRFFLLLGWKGSGNRNHRLNNKTTQTQWLTTTSFSGNALSFSSVSTVDSFETMNRKQTQS